MTNKCYKHNPWQEKLDRVVEYHKKENRENLIKKGIDPDAPRVQDPSLQERFDLVCGKHN